MPFVPVGVRITCNETQKENKENIPPETSTSRRDGCTTFFQIRCSICGGRDPRKCSSACSDKLLDKVLKDYKNRIFVPISED
jgi:hypothetical protein